MSKTRDPARNRVTPLGDIVAVAGRGAWMGNRGRLHEGRAARDVVRNHQGKAWLICALSFAGQRLPQWEPGHNTQLFFLDEAVALAAGHRPCAACRRADYDRYRQAWAATNPGGTPRAKDMDERLHSERLPSRADGRRALHAAGWTGLPDGVFVVGEHGPAVVVGDHIAVWDASTNSYRGHHARPRSASAAVLTPRASVDVLRAGYQVHIGTD